MRRTIIFLIVLTLSSGVILAQDRGRTSADFLKIEIGARQAGMAGAFVGVADDVNAVLWNPAGLGLLKTWGFSGLHSEWLGDIRYDYLGAAFKPFGKDYAVGLSATMLYIPSWDNTRGKEEAVSASDMAAMLSLSKRLPKGFIIGANLKYISSKLAGCSASAYAGDIGGIYQLPFNLGSWLNFLTVGAAVQNLGTQIKFINASNHLPLTLKGGVSLRLGYGRSHDILLTTEVDYPYYDKTFTSNLGIEYWLWQTIALRAGYKVNQDARRFTFGLGLRYGMLRFDYAFLPFKKEMSNLGHPLSSHQSSLFMRSVAPLPFDMLSPGLSKKEVLKKKTPIDIVEKKTVSYIDDFDRTLFKWKAAIDPDPGDSITYQILYAKIEHPEGENLREIVRNFLKKNKTIPWKVGWVKKESKEDTLKYRVTAADSVRLTKGVYLVKIKAVDRKGHSRDSKGAFRIIDIRKRVPPRLKQPPDGKIIDLIAGTTESKAYPKWGKALFASAATPWPDLARESNQPQKRRKLLFEWSPGRLELPLSSCTLLIYKDSTGTVLYDSCFVGTDSSGTVEFPIPYGESTYYWKVRARSRGTVKETPLWSFTLRAETIKCPFGPGGKPDIADQIPWDSVRTELPDTLQVSTVTTVVADLPMLPVFFFSPNSIDLDKDSEEALSIFVKTLKEKSIANKDVIFIVKGYVDSLSETSNEEEAFKLALKRAAYIRKRLIANDKELASKVVIDTLKAPEFWEFRNKEISLSRAYPYKEQLLAENRRVEIEAKVKGAKAIEDAFNKGELLTDPLKIKQLKQILERNRDVIAILEGESKQALLNSRAALRAVLPERYHPHLFVYKTPGGNRRVTMFITAERLTYRPLPPERRPSELHSSSCKTKMNVNSVVPFNWKLKLVDYKTKEELITLAEGRCESGYQNWHKEVSWTSEEARFRRGIYENYTLKLSIKDDLGRDFVFYHPVVVKVIEKEVIKEIKIIIQHIFNTVYAESRFLETQVEQFARELIQRDPKVFTIQISGHTCHIGSYKRNQELSLSRAATVRNSLLTHLWILGKEAKTGLQKLRARQWREKIQTMVVVEDWKRDAYFGCDFRYPYGTSLHVDKSLAEEEIRSEVEKFNESPIKRAMNRRTQVNIIEVRKGRR